MTAHNSQNEIFFKTLADLVNQYEKIVYTNPQLSVEEYNQLFRLIHSIKGHAATYGCHEIAHYAHNFEEQFVSAKNSRELISNRPLLTQFIFKVRYYINFATLNQAVA